MKFQDVKGFLGHAAKTIASPKTIALLGCAVALFQLVLAVEEFRSHATGDEDEDDDR
jgi:hypothetical protein